MIIKKLMAATANAGKLRELRAAFHQAGVEVVAAPEGAPSPEESGDTFESNAVIKALGYAAAAETGMPVLADDSGLVTSLPDGFPGVRSARYADEAGGYRSAFYDLQRRIQEAGFPIVGSPAKFVCVLCLWLPETGERRVYRGECDGVLAFPAVGDGGFGYDPIFIPSGHDAPFSLLPMETKARISHRAKAIALMSGDLQMGVK